MRLAALVGSQLEFVARTGASEHELAAQAADWKAWKWVERVGGCGWITVAGKNECAIQRLVIDAKTNFLS